MITERVNTARLRLRSADYHREQLAIVAMKQVSPILYMNFLNALWIDIDNRRH